MPWSKPIDFSVTHTVTTTEANVGLSTVRQQIGIRQRIRLINLHCRYVTGAHICHMGYEQTRDAATLRVALYQDSGAGAGRGEHAISFPPYIDIWPETLYAQIAGDLTAADSIHLRGTYRMRK